MKLGHDAAADELERASKDLLEAVEASLSGGRFAARLLDFGNVLFGNSLVRDCLDAVLAERSRPSVLPGAWQQVVRRAQPFFVELDQALLNFVNQLDGDDAFRKKLNTITTKMKRVVTWRGADRSVYEVVQFLCSGGAAGVLSVQRDEVNLVNTQILGGVAALLEALEDHADVYFYPAIGKKVRGAREVLVVGATQLDELEKLTRESTLREVADHVRDVHARIEEVLLGAAALPLPPGHPFAQMSDINYCRSIADGAMLLHRFVDARLRLGPVQHHVLLRLCSYLEHFGRGPLVERLDAAGFKDAERIVQSEVDRFVFGEGIFPITHAVAGRGRIDTFVELDAAALFGEIEARREIPFLLEMKQSLAKPRRRPPSVAAMRRYVRVKAQLALEQAEDYRRHLRVKPRWKDHEVYALVVYNGPVRFMPGDKPVHLVYVGDAPPSAPKQALW